MQDHIVISGKGDTSEATKAIVAAMASGTVLQVQSARVSDILAECRAALGVGNKVRHIDIVGHGGPGFLSLNPHGSEEISCEPSSVMNLGKLTQLFEMEGAHLRLLGCGTGTDGLHGQNDGPVLLAWIAQVMPGVRVTAPVCDIDATLFAPGGIQLTEDYFAGLVDGEALPTSSPVRVLGGDSSRQPAAPFFAPSVLHELLDQAGFSEPDASRIASLESTWIDASQLLLATVELAATTVGDDTLTLGIARLGDRLCVDSRARQQRLLLTSAIDTPTLEIAQLIERAQGRNQ